MGEPTAQEIDDFIRANNVDERAANDLKSCSAEIQRKVLARGELSTARNPSAAVLARIRDARSSPSVGGGGGGGGARSEEVEDFIKNNEVDESAADMLRSASPTVQRTVLSRGELKTARNPSSALLSRIRDAKSGGGDRDRDRGPDGGMPPPPGGMPPIGMPGYGYGYGMYPGAYPGYPGYPGYPMAPQADSRGYSGAAAGTMPQAGGAYGAYPGACGAYGAYAQYYNMGQAGAYGAAQPPAQQAAITQGEPTAAAGGGRRRSRSRNRSSSSSYSPSPSPTRKRRRRGRK